MPTFDQSQADCVVYVYREGIASAVGHDLALEVGDFTITVDGGPASAKQVNAEFDAGSLRVRHAMENDEPKEGKPSSRDRKKIEKNIRRDVLDAKGFPTITFRSTELERRADTVHVEGVLGLHGVEQAISFEAEVVDEETIARVRLDQTRFGIEPYMALLGALKIKPELDVEVRVPFAP